LLEVQVDKGAPEGEKYVFHGEADEYVLLVNNNSYFSLELNLEM
jgi:hypothetical protein